MTAPPQGSQDRRAPLPAPRARKRPRERPASRIVPVACWTIVVLCVSAFAFSLAVPLWYQLNGQRLLLVTSGSMEPEFSAGDAVVVQNITDPSQLQVDQVVTFWPPDSNRLVTHRIIDLQRLPVLEQNLGTGRMDPVIDPATGEPRMQEYIFTKGDNNPHPDPNATPWEAVRGVVLSVQPQWGSVLSWAHSPIGRFWMLAPPLLLLAGMEIAGLIAERRRRSAAPPDPAPGPDDAYLLD